jgi:hypothetical protein
LIIIIAVKYADILYTVLVGEDAGMLVLLCYHAKNLPKAIYFRPEPKLYSKSYRGWDPKHEAYPKGDYIYPT